MGILDDGTVQQQYQGFTNQIVGAAKTFRLNFNEAKEQGGEFILENIDGKRLSIKNRATYSLYKYTPHIAGAELFFDIYQDFFK